MIPYLNFIIAFRKEKCNKDGYACFENSASLDENTCCFNYLYFSFSFVAMVRETGVQSLVESYQRLKKWYSIPPYQIRIKGQVEQARELSSALPNTSVL